MPASTVGTGSLGFVPYLDTKQVYAQIDEFNKKVAGMGEKVKEQASTLDDVAKRLSTIIKGYLTFSLAKGFATELIRVRGEFEKLEISFQTMLKSKQKADILMAEVVDLAAKTPFSLSEAATGAKQLLAYGFAAEDVKKTLVTLGDVAAGVGAPLGDIVYLYGTLRTQGRAYTRDIMQFTSRGIPILEELAKQFGVATSEIQGMVEAGQVGFKDVERAFKSMTSEGGLFANLMQQLSVSMSGVFERLKDAWELMMNDIAKSNEGPIKAVLEGATLVVENYDKVVKTIGVAIAAFGAYKAAVLVTSAAQAVAASTAKGWTVAQTLLYYATLATEKATKLLNATILANPYAAITAAVVALIAALVLFRKETKMVKSAQDILNQVNTEMGKGVNEQKASVDTLLKALQQERVSNESRLEIYNKLRAINPELVKGLDAKTLSYQKLIKNVDEYTAALDKQYRFEKNEKAANASREAADAISDRYKSLAAELAKLNNVQLRADQIGPYGLVTVTAREQRKKDIKNELESLTKSLDDQNKITQSFVDENVKILTGGQQQTIALNKAFYEQRLKEANENLNKLTETELANGQGDVFRQQMKEAKEKLKLWEDPEKAVKAAAKAQDSYNTMLEKQIDLMEELAKLERDAEQTGYTDKARELDGINQRYDDMLNKLDEYNRKVLEFNKKNPANRLQLAGQAEVDRINASRAVELQNLQYKEDAANFLEALDQKRDAFELLRQTEYEGTRQQVDYVREQYKDQLGEAKNYLQLLQATLASVAIKSTVAPLNYKDFLITEDLKKKIKAEEISNDKEAKERQKKEFDDFIDQTQKYYVKRQAIIKKYDRLNQQLSDNRVNMNQKMYDKTLNDLNEAQLDEQRELAKEFLENSKAFQEYEKGFSDKGPAAVEKLIKKLKDLREEMKKQGLVLTDIDEAIVKSSGEKFAVVARDIAGFMSQISGSIEIELSKTVKITGQQVTQIFSNLSTLFSSDSSKSAKQSSIIGLIYSFVSTASNVITTALQTKKDLETGLEPSADAASNITRALQAQNAELERQSALLDDMYGEDKINGLLKLQDDLQKKQAETFEALRDLQIDAIVKQGEYFIDSLFHGSGEILRSDTTAGRLFKLLNDPLGFIPKKVKVSLETIDTTGFNDIEDFIKLLAEIKANDGKYKGFTVVEDDIRALEELITAYDELDKKQKEVRAQIMELFTGTTSDAIVNSIVEGFRQGKRSAEDFADTFEDLMRGAMLNSLKYQTLEKPLKDFYEIFANRAGSDGILTETEIGELRDLYAQIINAAADQYKNLEAITGINLGATSAQTATLAGALKGMSEQTAEVMAGQLGGLRIDVAAQTRLATASLEVQNQIQINTANLAPMLAVLRRMFDEGVKFR